MYVSFSYESFGLIPPKTELFCSQAELGLVLWLLSVAWDACEWPCKFLMIFLTPEQMQQTPRVRFLSTTTFLKFVTKHNNSVVKRNSYDLVDYRDIAR